MVARHEDQADPKVVQEDTCQEHDPSQAWFWTPEWQEGEREADEDIAAGCTFRQNSTEEFLAFLHARPLADADA